MASYNVVGAKCECFDTLRCVAFIVTGALEMDLFGDGFDDDLFSEGKSQKVDINRPETTWIPHMYEPEVSSFHACQPFSF